jgi:two-component system response regulator HydG
MPGRILIVDDDQAVCEYLAAALPSRQFEVTWRTSAESAFAELKNREFDAVLTDLSMPGLNGIELCERITANRPDVPVVVLTAFGSMDAAIHAIRAGAYDFVTKPIEIEMLALTLARAVRHRQLQETVRVLSQDSGRAPAFDDVVGESPAMLDLLEQLGRVVACDATILLTGETGTGKELLARTIHARSRRSGPFVPVDCASLPDTLIESELFGHARGAFTDARTRRDGLFVRARGGTLFLDEIGEIPMALQPKLLRALEERAVRPVGADMEVPVDVRVVAATNRDLEAAIDEGRFRQDLFYRINVVQVEIPPLRSRGTDPLLLAQHFIRQAAARTGRPVTGLTRPVAERLLSYAWPGNVRELRNAMERAVAVTRFEQIVVEDLPEKIRTYRGPQVLAGGSDPAELRPLDAVERDYIFHVLEASGGNKSAAAGILGLDRTTLYRKLERYEESDGATKRRSDEGKGSRSEAAVS